MLVFKKWLMTLPIVWLFEVMINTVISVFTQLNLSYKMLDSVITAVFTWSD